MHNRLFLSEPSHNRRNEDYSLCLRDPSFVNMADLKQLHQHIAEIMYGEPAFDDELEEALQNGEIYLGGCCYYPDSPEYHCNKCGKNFPESPHDPDWGVEFDTDDENEDD